MEINYEKKLKEGLLLYVESEFSDVPPSNEIEHKFSERYIKRKEDMIKNFDKLLNGTYKFPKD